MPLSISQLISSTLDFDRKRSMTYQSIQIAGLKIGIFKSPTYVAADTPSMVRRVVMFNYVVRSESGSKPDPTWTSGITGGPPSGGYRVFIMIPNVNVRIMKSQDYPIKIANHRYMKPVSSNDKKIKVRCDCHDFRWRFAYYDNKNQALYGAAPPPYSPVPGSTRGPVNPRGLPGVCKHIMACFKHMSQNGYVV